MTEEAGVMERIRRVVMAFVAALGASLPALARQDTAPGGGGAGDGAGAEYWMGLIATGEPSLPEMTIVVTFRRAAGASEAWTASLDVPRGPGVSGAIGVRLKDVVYTEKEIKFASPPPPVENQYELVRSLDGKTARGRLLVAKIQPVLLKMWKVSEPEALSAITRRPQNPRDPLPYTEREVKVTGTNGTVLAGTLTLPGPASGASSAPHAAPAMLLLGDVGPHNRDGAMGTHKPMLVWADQLARLGVATLRLDDRGVGDSGGDYHDATMETLAADARACVEFLKTQPGIDRGRVGILGMGEGAGVAALVSGASKNADDLRLLVLLAPSGLRGAEQVPLSAARKMEAMGERPALIAARRERVQRMLGLIAANGSEEEARRLLVEDVRETERAPGARGGLSEEDIQDIAGRRLTELTTPHMRSWLAEDPVAALANIRCDVEAIIGENDLISPARENMDAIGAAFDKLSDHGVGESGVMIQPGVNHWMQPSSTGFEDEYDQVELTISPDVLTRVLQWVGRKMDVKNAK